MLLIAAIGKCVRGRNVSSWRVTRRAFVPDLRFQNFRKRGAHLRRNGIRKAQLCFMRRVGNYQRFALDEGGTIFDSIGLAAAIDKILSHGKGVAFLIGGAEGLERAGSRSMRYQNFFWPN